MKKSSPHKGNALLIALLLTSVLVLITLGLARLVNNETFQIAELIKSGKSEYLAEAGSEIALYQVHTEGPGFQPEEFDTPLLLEPEAENESFSYKILAKTNTVPIVPKYIEEGTKNRSLPRSELFSKLQLGESVQIPILENPNNILGQSFEVEYYLAAETNGGVINSDWDILLWKLFGINNGGNLDSMSEYFPASRALGGKDLASNGIIGTTAESPAIFGSSSNSNGFNCGTFFPYSAGTEDESNLLTGTDTESRCETLIKNFLDTHHDVYLVLTNAINVSQLTHPDGGTTKDDIAVIRYRICTPDCSSPGYEGLSPIQTQIFSEGKFAQNIKQLSTSVNPQGFLPAFDFSIYRTTD